MKHFLCCLFAAALAVSAAARVEAQTPRVKLTMKDGRVTISARDVPLRELLDEWARVGQTRIVNADKLTGPRITIQLVDTAERDALDIILRSAAGYIAAPRRGNQPGMTTYDRITILATSSRPPAMNASMAPQPEMVAPSTATIRGGEYIPDSAEVADVVQEEAPQTAAAEYQPMVAPPTGPQPHLEFAQPRDFNNLMATPGQTAPPPPSAPPAVLSIPGRYTYPLPSGGRIGGGNF